MIEKRPLFKMWGYRFFMLGMMSLMLSLISLAMPLYMFNLYDRVLSSNSVETLLSLTVITLFVLLCYGGFDWARMLIQQQIGRSLDKVVRPKLMKMSLKLSAAGHDVRMRMAKFEELHGFLISQSFASIFDLIFVPVYFSVLYLLHPVIFLICLVFAFFTVGLALLMEWHSKTVTIEHWKLKNDIKKDESALMANAYALSPLGRVGSIVKKFLTHYEETEEQIQKNGLILGRVQTMNKMAMMIIQTLILGITAYLVIQRHVSTSVLFAVNIISMRALQPLFQLTSSFRSLSKAADSWKDITDMLINYKEHEREEQPITEPFLRLRSITVFDPSEDRKIIHNIHMDVDPTEIVVVTGESGAGKSTLLRVVAGLIPKYIGSATLDGREMKFWNFERPSAFIGYLPQDVRFLNATIAENITGEDSPDMDALIALCSEVGIHKDIAALKDGYGTVINANSPQFSGGQVRLLGIARALWSEPKLLVLDEPTNGIDFNREKLIIEAIKKRQQTGASILIATHSPHIMRIATKIMWLKLGQTKSYGMRDEVLAKMKIIKEAA